MGVSDKFNKQSLSNYQKWVLFWLNLGAALLHTSTSITAIFLNIFYPQIQFYVTGLKYTNNLEHGEFIVDVFVQSRFSIVGLAATYGLVDALYHYFMAYYCYPGEGRGSVYDRIMVRNVNPIRWMTYAVSASLQFMVYSIVTNFSNDFQLTLTVIMMSLIMSFGWIQEEWNNLEDVHQTWIVDITDKRSNNSGTYSWNPKTTGNNLNFFYLMLVKFIPLIISTVPYLVQWTLLFVNYFDRVDTHPAYSEALIIGGFISFFGFVLVMTLQTIGVASFRRDEAVSWYYNVEISYQILSFTAKFFQSATMIIAMSVYVAQNPLE